MSVFNYIKPSQFTVDFFLIFLNRQKRLARQLERIHAEKFHKLA